MKSACVIIPCRFASSRFHAKPLAILNNKPLLSENGLAGHLGFTTTTLGKTKCGSGRIGTFESVASGKAMANI